MQALAAALEAACLSYNWTAPPNPPDALYLDTDLGAALDRSNDSLLFDKRLGREVHWGESGLHIPVEVYRECEFCFYFE